MRIETYTPYKPIYDRAIDCIIKSGKYSNDPEIQAQLDSMGIKVLEPYGGKGDCQSWAFENIGLSEYAQGHITLEDLEKIGFQETKEPSHGDLAVVYGAHYGIIYDKFHGETRIIAKLGINGAVCIHPWNAFSGGIYVPKYYKREETSNYLTLQPLP